jgi:hypothetical protein
MNKGIKECCLRTQDLPESYNGTVTFEAVAFDNGDFSQAVNVAIHKQGIDAPLVLSATLSGAGALTLDLTGVDYLSRFAGEYCLEAFRADNGVRVLFRERPGEEESYPGLCFCAYPCQIPTPDNLLVLAWEDLCPNACTPCPCP